MKDANQTNWNQEKLGDVCELIKRGIAPKYLESGGVQVVNQKCIRNHEIDYSLARRNDPEVKRVPEERLIQVGDVLVNSTGTGTLGRVAQVREQPPELTTVDTHVTIVRPTPGKFFPEFFGYMMIAIEDELISGGYGASGQTELPRTDLEKKYSVSFPTSFEEQQRIVAILDEAFEGLARARAHAEANLQNALELFESLRFVMLFEQTDGWETHALGNCFRLKSGENLTAKKMVPGPFPVYGGNGIAGTHHESNLSGDNVIIGRVGALCGNARYIDHDIWLTDNAFKVVNYHFDFDQRFLAYLLNFKNLRSLARQAAQPVISNSSLADLELTFPASVELQAELANKLSNAETELEDFKKKYETKIQYLDDLRQSLLQKAFAGELR